MRTRSSAAAGDSKQTSAKPKTGLEAHLEDVAFTTRNHALRFNWPGRQTHQTILARAGNSSKPYKTVLAAATPKGPSILRENFHFTAKELEPEPEANDQKVMVVGITLMDELFEDLELREEMDEAAGEDSKTKKKTKKRGTKKHTGIIGVALPRENHKTYELPKQYTGHEPKDLFEGLDSDEEDDDETVQPPKPEKDLRALLVVSMYYQTPPAGGMKLFALLGPDKNGLCGLYNCDGKDVFYFSEFRDHIKSGADRLARWNGLVKKQVVTQLGGEAPEMSAYATLRDKAVVMVDPTVAFANKVMMLTASLATNKDPWIMTKLKDTLDEALDPLLQHVRDWPHIRAFLVDDSMAGIEAHDSQSSDDEGSNAAEAASGVDGASAEEEDDDEDDPGVEEDKDKDMSDPEFVWSAASMALEVEQRWPETAKELNSSLLQRLHDAIVHLGGIDLAADEVEPFLRMAPLFMPAPDQAVHRDTGTVLSLLDAMRAARCNVSEEALSRVSIQDGNLPALMKCVVDSLKMLRAENLAQAKALHAKLGNDVVPTTPAHCMKMYGDKADTDSARLLFDAFYKFLLYWNQGTADIITPRIDEIIEVLEVAMGTKKKKQAKAAPKSKAKQKAKAAPKDKAKAASKDKAKAASKDKAKQKAKKGVVVEEE
jgi:hypothetical protein